MRTRSVRSRAAQASEARLYTNKWDLRIQGNEHTVNILIQNHNDILQAGSMLL